jgi:hypothetical protein
MACVPAAAIFGMLGCIKDGKRLLAIICTVISGGLILIWLVQMGLLMG